MNSASEKMREMESKGNGIEQPAMKGQEFGLMHQVTC